MEECPRQVFTDASSEPLPAGASSCWCDCQISSAEAGRVWEKWEGLWGQVGSKGRDITEGYQGAGTRGPEGWAKDPRRLWKNTTDETKVFIPLRDTGSHPNSVWESSSVLSSNAAMELFLRFYISEASLICWVCLSMASYYFTPIPLRHTSGSLMFSSAFITCFLYFCVFQSLSFFIYTFILFYLFF